MRPVASLLAQCHVVSNIDFLENTSQKPPGLQTKVMDVQQLTLDAYFDNALSFTLCIRTPQDKDHAHVLFISTHQSQHR